MSLKIGITGGIGSGKSFVSKIFKALGVPFYDADKEAKALMHTNAQIRKGLIEAFGQSTYTSNGELDRGYLSNKVFSDKEQLAILNAIVHPVVIQHAKDWAEAQTTYYSLKEAALLFESGSYKTLDYTIMVTAPENLRVTRVMQRDNVSEDEVRKRMANQMSEEEKEKLADFVIINDGKQPLLPQIINIHEQLRQNKCAK